MIDAFLNFIWWLAVFMTIGAVCRLIYDTARLYFEYRYRYMRPRDGF